MSAILGIMLIVLALPVIVTGVLYSLLKAALRFYDKQLGEDNNVGY